MGSGPGWRDHRNGWISSSATDITSVFRSVVSRAPLGLAAAGVTAALAGVAAYSHWIEPYWLHVSHPTVEIAELPAEFDGLRIAHLSDFHLGRTLDARCPVVQAVEACNNQHPDIVVLTGDYISQRQSTANLIALVRKLKTRPIFAVLGNHDYRFGPNHRRTLSRSLTEVGVTLLENRSAVFERNGARLWFVGVGDAYTSHDRLNEAQQTLRESDQPRVLLTHYPDFLLDVPAHQFDLAFAGHSHGGQINLPMLTQRALAHSDTVFAGGLYWVGGTPLYVSRGLGTSSHRIRFLAPPELSVMTLRSPAAGSG